MFYRLGNSHSDLVMDLAHWEGATPVHVAARAGNYKLVQNLLAAHGAGGSVHLKNKLGCTPIDVARVFGPHHEVSGLLGAAMCSSLAESRSAPNRLIAREESFLRLARSGATAISMQYPMWLISVSELLKLSALRPHQELRAAGKLVRWDASLKGVFFLSHQWTSFTRPDHSNQQLRTIQRFLTRMIQGNLPDTAPSFKDAARFTSKVRVTSKEWKALVARAYVWLDFISVSVSVTLPARLSTLRWRTTRACTLNTRSLKTWEPIWSKVSKTSVK